MRRVFNRTGQLVVDASVLTIAYFVAFYLRFDGQLPLQMLKRMVFTWPYIVAFQFILLTVFGVRRFAWRYIGLREANRILAAIAVGGLVLLVVRLVAGYALPRFAYAQYALVPAGVIVIDSLLAFLGITGARALRRILAERSETILRRGNNSDGSNDIPTLLVGAGQAGVMVAREIARRPDLGISAVGFVDDDPMKIGSVVHGITVLGPSGQIPELCEKLEARQVLITIANAPGSEIRRLISICERAELAVKIIPGIYEIVGGTVNLSRIRPVAIEDLLGRDPVTLDTEAISAIVGKSVVLVTGAGGSIGSELCRQLCNFQPRKLLLVERSENNLFEIHRELLRLFPDVEIVPLLADICDASRVNDLLAQHRPRLIFHAAAHKHVPMMEWNAGEAIKNNVFGTKVLADAANAHDVEIFVQISTDKAVNPSSVMGASKRVAEMYLQSRQASAATRFVTVRFGNVLGSAGSVVRIFREQIANGGPVTVTHPDMRRYFMLTQEACQLVLEAASFARGGEIFVLDMGEPVKVVDLARDMIRLSGYDPEVEIKIEFTGPRPGEKLFEELLGTEENHSRTVHPKILVGRIPPVEQDRIERALIALHHVVDKSSDDVRLALSKVVIEAQLECGPATATEPVHIPPLARSASTVS